VPPRRENHPTAALGLELSAEEIGRIDAPFPRWPARPLPRSRRAGGPTPARVASGREKATPTCAHRGLVSALPVLRAW